MIFRKRMAVNILYLILTFLFASKVNFSQFLLTSSYPTHGAVNVDTAATFSLTFNAPIDTSKRFQYPQNFFCNLFIYPKSLVGEPDSITFSPDMHTVYVHNLHLIDNVIYLFVLADAVSLSGDSLDQPYSMVFTTSSGLPLASISGTVTYPGNDPAGTWVVLLDEYPFGNDSTDVVNGIVVSPSVSNYTIDYIIPEYYWPAAIKKFHIDEDGDPVIESGCGMGFYDQDGDYYIDSIEINTGANIFNIDFTLFTVNYQTARDPFPALETAVQLWEPDAFLAGIQSEIEPDGQSLIWQYLFYSPTIEEHSGWVGAGDLIVRAEPSDFEGDTIQVPVNWLDSDSVLNITEANGGYDFRQTFEDAQLFSALGKMNFDESSSQLYFSKGIKHGWNSPFIIDNSNNMLEWLENTNFKPSNPRESALIEPPVIWGISYYSPSTEAQLLFILDPVTGEILNFPTTASVAEQNALPVAQSWSPDAKLWMVINHSSPVDPLGQTQMWMGIYYSQQKDSLNGVVVWGKIPVHIGPVGFPLIDTLTVPAGWFDSDVTIAVAEAVGGADYRNTNLDVFVHANISRWRNGINPDLTVWIFRYTSSTAPDLVIIVNAFTGLIVDVEETENYYPKQFELFQNYPNPFNPSTKIKFTIPQDERGKTKNITLKVYDVLGNEIATLVNEEKPAGTYEVNFDAGAYNISSGIYFYQLKAGNLVKTNKMILLK